MGSWERKHDCFLYFVHNQNMKLQSFRKDSIQVIVTSFDVFTSTKCRDLISSSQATLSVDHPPQLLYHYWVPFCKFQPHFIGKIRKRWPTISITSHVALQTRPLWPHRALNRMVNGFSHSSCMMDVCFCWSIHLSSQFTVSRGVIRDISWYIYRKWWLQMYKYVQTILIHKRKESLNSGEFV